MKKYSLVALLLLSVLSSSLIAMKRGSEPNSPTKRPHDDSAEMPFLENLQLQSPKKKPYINRSVTRTEWQEQLSPNSRLPLLCPVEHTKVVSVEVDPVVHAVYHDDVEELQKLFETTRPNLTDFMPGILSTNEDGTLLDIAADRGSYKCIAYFITILTAAQRNFTLQECAVRALLNTQDAARCLDAWKIEQYASTVSMHVGYHIEPKLRDLFKISRYSALRIARAHKDGRCEVLLKKELP